MIVAGTGHRPDKLGGYHEGFKSILQDFAVGVVMRERPTGLISGMALGWDQALAVAAIRCGVPFVAAIPFEGQERRWPEASQRDYRNILAAASTVHIVESAPSNRAFRRRNEWMVDNSVTLWALWNGDRTGGTYDAVLYAREGRRRILNLWDDWCRYKEQMGLDLV